MRNYVANNLTDTEKKTQKIYAYCTVVSVPAA